MAIIALSLMIMESAINRVKFRRKLESKRSAIDALARIINRVDLRADMEEVFAVRDAIVHNHIWRGDVYWDDNGNLGYDAPPELVEGYGDKKFLRVLDLQTQQSHRLGLNLLPPKIWRRDALLILKTVVMALNSLHDSESEEHIFTRTRISYHSALITVDEAIDRIEIPAS